MFAGSLGQFILEKCTEKGADRQDGFIILYQDHSLNKESQNSRIISKPKSTLQILASDGLAPCSLIV